MQQQNVRCGELLLDDAVTLAKIGVIKEGYLLLEMGICKELSSVQPKEWKDEVTDLEEK